MDFNFSDLKEKKVNWSEFSEDSIKFYERFKMQTNQFLLPNSRFQLSCNNEFLGQIQFFY
jgi:hypothetical protein